MKKKLFAILMSAMMMVTFMPALAFATDTAAIEKDLAQFDLANHYKTEVDVETNATALHDQVVAGKYKLLSTADLQKVVNKEKWAGKKVVIIDTMPAGWFANLHIPGAVNAFAPLSTGEHKLNAAEKKDLCQKVGFKSEKAAKKAAKKSKLYIVTYCGFVKCTRSHEAAKYLRSLGFKNVYRQSGGIKAWYAAGYPIEGAYAK